MVAEVALIPAVATVPVVAMTLHNKLTSQIPAVKETLAIFAATVLVSAGLPVATILSPRNPAEGA